MAEDIGGSLQPAKMIVVPTRQCLQEDASRPAAETHLKRYSGLRSMISMREGMTERVGVAEVRCRSGLEVKDALSTRTLRPIFVARGP